MELALILPVFIHKYQQMTMFEDKALDAVCIDQSFCNN